MSLRSRLGLSSEATIPARTRLINRLRYLNKQLDEIRAEIEAGRYGQVEHKMRKLKREIDISYRLFMEAERE